LSCGGDLVRCGSFRFPAGFEDFQHGGDKRDEDDGEDHQLEVLFHEGNIAKEVAHEGEDRHPGNPAHHVIGDETAVLHGAHSGHKRCEGADDGDEAGQDNGLTAVLLVEFLGAVQVLFLEELDIPAESPLANKSADGVVNGISQHRGQGQQAKKVKGVQGAQGGEGAGREQQGISRQKGGDHQTGFYKDHKKQDAVSPGPVIGNYFIQMHVHVQDKIDQEFDDFHAASLC